MVIDGAGEPDERVDPIGELILASASGDRDAFARLYDQLAPRAFGLISRIVADESGAKTALREAFLDVWRRADEFAPSMSGRTWIIEIVHRHAVRARGLRSGGDVAPGHPEPRIEGRRLARSVAALSGDQRAVIAHAYFAGRSQAEIAAITGTSVEAVRATMRDGLSRLRTELGVTT